MKAQSAPSAVSSRTSHDVTPRTDCRTLLRHAVQERWRTVGTELKRCQPQPSEETVHDVRVAMQQDQLAVAISAVDAAFNEVVQRKRAIAAADRAARHRLRVAFKNFR
jgi:hypothetical protein